MDSNIIAKLLSKIHTYYPVGLPGLYNSYPGFELLKTKISDKFNFESNTENNRLKELRLEIKNSLGLDTKVRFYQFPNYYLEIELESLKDEGLQKQSWIAIVISLLAEYYTVYISEEYKVSLYDLSKSTESTPIYQIVYHKSSKKRQLLGNIESLIHVTKHFFPEYEYLSHKPLFDTKVEGCGIFNDMDSYKFRDSHSIYEFLFDCHSSFNPKVLD